MGSRNDGTPNDLWVTSARYALPGETPGVGEFASTSELGHTAIFTLGESPVAKINPVAGADNLSIDLE